MESRVGALALKVRAPAERLEALRRPAEEFVTRILRRCGELLSERVPGRVLLLRDLDLELRLLEGALSSEPEIGAFAAEIAGRIEAAAQTGGEAASGDPAISVFDDEIAWRAAHLEAWAMGRSAGDWRFDALEAEGQPMRTLIDGEKEPLLLEILARLFHRGTLEETLGALPAEVVEVLARAIGAPREGPSPNGPPAPRGEATALAARLRPETRLAPARVFLAVASRAARGVSASGAEIARASHAALTAFLGTMPSSGDAIAGSIEPAREPRGVPTPAATPGIATQFGGLFYLLSLALELGLGEILWRACLPEGAVFARAAAALLGEAGEEDPAAALLGGTPPGETCPDVGPEQQEEIAASLLPALLAALPRRGLAALPEPLLRLHDTPSGRLLLASARDSAFILFALPAQAPDVTRAALERFLALWPASAPAPRGGDALAGLDRRARVRPSKARALVPPFAPEAGSPATAALLAQIAGSLCHLFAARLGMERPWRPADLAAYLRVPARVVVTDDTIEVRIPMERIDVNVRRAGLDADPGRVPWLNRRVSLEFVDEASLG